MFTSQMHRQPQDNEKQEAHFALIATKLFVECLVQTALLCSEIENVG